MLRSLDCSSRCAGVDSRDHAHDGSQPSVTSVPRNSPSTHMVHVCTYMQANTHRHKIKSIFLKREIEYFDKKARDQKDLPREAWYLAEKLDPAQNSYGPFSLAF